MPRSPARRHHGSARRFDLPHHLVARPRPTSSRKQRRPPRTRLGSIAHPDRDRTRVGTLLMTRPRLFLDADGVLADFDRGSRDLLGMSPKEFIARHGRGTFWKRLAKAKN